MLTVNKFIMFEFETILFIVSMTTYLFNCGIKRYNGLICFGFVNVFRLFVMI